MLLDRWVRQCTFARCKPIFLLHLLISRPLTFQQLDDLMLKHHALERMIRLALAHTLAGVLARQIELQSFTAEQRFRALMRRSPHILQLVPHKYLASYLGLDPTNFSKFLGTIRL
ncbi:MAG: hypothetical protein LH618_07740 [Saprospiraceae bacterium]|nr:hypothetical protein [Saprospiraceae bacterium]